jgi:hypothetical protein
VFSLVAERRKQWAAIDAAYLSVLGRSAEGDPGAVAFMAKWRAAGWAEGEAVDVRLTKGLCTSGEYLASHQPQTKRRRDDDDRKRKGAPLLPPPPPGPRLTHALPCVSLCSTLPSYAKDKAPAACEAAAAAAAASAASAGSARW